MSDVLRVLWTIVPQTAPQPWLPCSRCHNSRAFRSSDKFRINANGKRLDAWLIYNCTVCGNTWNRPLLERRTVASIGPEFLTQLQENDPETARRLALDLGDLRGKAPRIEVFPEVGVQKTLISGSVAPGRRLEISFSLSIPVGLRLDRLLTSELGLSRSRLQQLYDRSRLILSPERTRKLRKPPADGMRLSIDLRQVCDAAAIASAAVHNGGPADSVSDSTQSRKARTRGSPRRSFR